MNKIIIHGRMTRDPELKNTDKSCVCKFTVADNPRYNRETPNYHDCEAWGKSGEFVAQYFRKGSEIVLSGELRQRNYEAKDGSKRTAWSVNVDMVDFCGKANDNAGYANKSYGATGQAAPVFEEIKSDDELPF